MCVRPPGVEDQAELATLLEHEKEAAGLLDMRRELKNAGVPELLDERGVGGPRLAQHRVHGHGRKKLGSATRVNVMLQNVFRHQPKLQVVRETVTEISHARCHLRERNLALLILNRFPSGDGVAIAAPRCLQRRPRRSW